MKILGAFLLSLFACSAWAELTFPVDVSQWEGRTAYLIVPTDTGTPYQLRYYPDGSTYKDWPRADGGDFGVPLPTVGGEPAGLVYPIRLADPPTAPAFFSSIEQLEEAQHFCGPSASDPRQPPACGATTDQIITAWSIIPLDEEQVLRNANSVAGEKYYDLFQADGWELREALQMAINMGKDRQVNLGATLTRLDDENWSILSGYFQQLMAKVRELRAQIKCKYDSGNCSYNVNGTSVDVTPVVGANFETGWPALPTIPEL